MIQDKEISDVLVRLTKECMKNDIDFNPINVYHDYYELLPSYRKEVHNGDYDTMMDLKKLNCYLFTKDCYDVVKYE